MFRRALKQLKLLEQSLNNIGFIYNRQSLLFATGVLHKARKQLGRQPSCSGGVLECPSHHRHKGPFLHLRVLWGNSFPIAQHKRMKSWVDLSAGQGTCIPQKYANKNFFRLPHRKCSLQSTSSQGYLTKTVSHTMKTVFLWPLFRGEKM